MSRDAMAALRESAVVSRRDHVHAVRVGGPGAWDALDRLVGCDLWAQPGRMRHTLLLREDGTPFADVYVCADEDGFLLLAEGPTAEELMLHLAAHRPAAADASFELLDGEGALLGLDGPWAWELLADVLGPDSLGLPYLTFYRSGQVLCFRAGKTGEYGFDLLVPRAEAARWHGRLLEAGRRFEAAEAGLETLDQAALENWFFNVRREGQSGATPLELQLQWRVSRRKPFVGSEALADRRAAGVRERLVCLLGAGPLAVGEEVRLGGHPVGRVVNAGHCAARGEWVATALLDRTVAHAGLDGFTSAGGASLRSVSAPVLDNRSLYVHPQRHSWATRHELAFPPLA